MSFQTRPVAGGGLALLDLRLFRQRVGEAVKRAEDRDELLLRLYEANDRQSAATVSFEFPVSSVRKVPIAEDYISEITIAVDSFDLEFDPLEI